MKQKKKVCALILAFAMVFAMFVQVPGYKVKAAGPSVSYMSHVQTYGWEKQWKSDGAVSGTSGKAKRLEGIRIRVQGGNLGVRYTTHCQTYGWMPWVKNGEISGTEGEAKRLEAIKIELTGVDAQYYDVYYRVHAQTYGWLPWAKNGQAAGTAGYAKRLEAIQICIVKKGTEVPNTYHGVTSRSGRAYVSKDGRADADVDGRESTNISYRTHVQTYGWQGWKSNGTVAGTSGQAKRLEGINIKLSNEQYSGSVVYRTHVQSYGWQGWKSDGTMSGTKGEAKRLEAIQIYLTGEIAEYYDVYYRVHAQTYGWLGWVKNGTPSGTAGYAKRLEAIQIVLVKKDASAPGNVAGIVSTTPAGFVNKPGMQYPDNPAGSYGDNGEGWTPNPDNPGNNGNGGNTSSTVPDVTKYSYEIIPLLAPLNEYYYVKTDNPDPSYVGFKDKNSKYASDDKIAYLVPTATRFFDVQYENRTTGRVKGGYIYEASDAGADGGEFVLQQAQRAYTVTKSGNWTSTSNPGWQDTSVTISCPQVKNLTDYLVDEYTDPSKEFFANLDAVQSVLNTHAVYPKGIRDTSKVNTAHPYPLLATSPYQELSLNEHYEMFESTDDAMFLEYLHPMVLSSVGVPGVMANVAQRLQPSCTVEGTDLHYLVKITWNGETRSYGGAGNGNTDPIFSKYIETLFKFDGSAGDYASYQNAGALISNIDRMADKIHAYEKASTEELKTYKEQLTGQPFKDAVGTGNWLKVAAEGWFGYGGAYTYVSAYAGKGKGVAYMEDVWVDGRYINKNNCIDLKATYADHPTADIIVRNKTFVNANGQTVTQDVFYKYDEQKDGWYAVQSYFGRMNWWYEDDWKKLPEDMKLTHAQVEAMHVDANASKLPETGLIYDGTVAPGTPFINP